MMAHEAAPRLKNSVAPLQGVCETVLCTAYSKALRRAMRELNLMGGS